MFFNSSSLYVTLLEYLMKEHVPPNGKSARTTWGLSATAGARGGVQVEVAAALRSGGGIKMHLMSNCKNLVNKYIQMLSS